MCTQVSGFSRSQGYVELRKLASSTGSETPECPWSLLATLDRRYVGAWQPSAARAAWFLTRRRRVLIVGPPESGKTWLAALAVPDRPTPLVVGVAWCAPGGVGPALRQAAAVYAATKLSSRSPTERIKLTPGSYVIDGAEAHPAEVKAIVAEIAERDPTAPITITSRAHISLKGFHRLSVPRRVIWAGAASPARVQLTADATETLAALSPLEGPFDPVMACLVTRSANVAALLPKLRELVARGAVKRYPFEALTPLFVLTDGGKEMAALVEPTHARCLPGLVQTMLRTTKPNCLTPPDTAQLAWFDRNYRHLNRAADLALADNPPLGLELAAHLMPFWIAVRDFDRCWQFDDRRLEPACASTASLAYWMGQAKFTTHQLAAAADYHALALDQFALLGDDEGVATATYGLATAQQLLGQLELSRSTAEAGLAAATTPSCEAAHLNRLGYLSYLGGDWRTAEHQLVAALALGQLAQDERRAAIVQTNLGELFVSDGRLTDGAEWLAGADAAWRQLGDVFAWCSNLEAVALLDLRLGRPGQACLRLKRVVAFYRLQHFRLPSDAFEIATLIASRLGAHRKAVCLAHLAVRFRGGPAALRGWSETEPLRSREYLASAAALGGGVTSAVAWADRLSYGEALGLIASLGPPSSVGAPLTLREGEVASRLSAGSSNSAIAGELGISVRTVEVHVLRAARKLGVRNRTELALELLRAEGKPAAAKRGRNLGSASSP